MNYLFYVQSFTPLNILGSLSDPFEFEGDYGPEINPIRHKVFELVCVKRSYFQKSHLFSSGKAHGKGKCRCYGNKKI